MGNEYERRLDRPPLPQNIKEVELVLAELRTGKVSVGWRFNRQHTVHFFYLHRRPEEAAEIAARITRGEMTSQHIAMLDWHAVYLPRQKDAAE